MIGDSITDCGRIYENPPLGNGYVRFVRDSLKDKYPETEIEIINKGISGNTVRDLKGRWKRDVLDLNPDWLSIMIGINDVWQQMDNWTPRDYWITIDEYEQTLSGLIDSVAASLKGLVLMTPYVLQLDKTDEMRIKMDRYGNVVRDIAQKYGAVFVDAQAAFDKALQKVDWQRLSNDRVHMNDAGHKILADAFLGAVE